MSRRAFRSPARASGGWSLVELAIVLVVVGVIGVVLWRMLPLAPQVAAGDAARRDLEQAEQALVGYALAHSRLPAPLIEDGVALLPAETLGLPSRLKLRYQVQPALTAPPGDLFAPLLPPVYGGVGGTPTVSGQTNGLDFCMALKNAGALSLGGMDGIPTAFALMHGGPAGHDNLAGAAFALPGARNVGERRIVAIGPGEFAARLGCPDRVARVHGAARAAYTAYDLARIAHEYERLREFAVQVAEMNLENARANEMFAGFDVAYGIFLEALAILQEAAGWPPDPVGIATGIAAHVTATAQLAVAIVNLTSAVEERQAAEADVTQARLQHSASQTNSRRMQSLATTSLSRAQALDQRGLHP